MIIYHGSYIEIKEPDLLHSRENVDFGKAFYTTPIYEQAQSWCNRFKRRNKEAVINKYIFDESCKKDLKVLEFASYSEEWLEFIMTCRRNADTSDYDIVIGGVANDKIFNTVELYFDGLIDKNEAIKRIKYERPNVQIALRTEKAIKLGIKFEGSDVL